MIRQTLDLFSKKQYMDTSDYEIHRYSDVRAPKVVPHKHNFYEIYYLLSEQLDYVIGRQEYHMKKGDFLLMPPGLLHYPTDMHISPKNHYSRIVLWINIDFFENFIKIDSSINQMWDTVIKNNAYLIRPTTGASSHLYDHFLRLLNEKTHPEFASKAMIHSILMEIFVIINRILYRTPNFESHSTSANIFSNLINYIHSHLAEDLSLEILSKHFFVSKGYISQIFKKYMEISVHQYILSLRLEGSRKAIQAGIPIMTAVDMYGFHDYSSFYRAFKGAFQMSPKEYQMSSK